jgi:antitoxin component YwqK of YwqJK toxin-antitoxin module
MNLFMSQDQYLFSKDELIIRDHELNIDIALPSSLPRLPLNMSDHGVFQDRDAEGNLQSAYLVCDGRRHGECRLFNEEGKVRAEMFYHYGKLHGPSVMYSENGKILAKTWYYEGKRVGKAHYYFPSGSISSLQRFKDGEWEGLQEYFYEDGSKKSFISFLRGKLHGEVRLFWEAGKPKRSVHYVAGLREGPDQLWNEKGILIDEGEYRSGQPVGVHRHYFADGKLKEELNFHTPTRFDRREWSLEGKLIFEGIFALDLSYVEKIYSEPQECKVRKGVWDGTRVRWK